MTKSKQVTNAGVTLMPITKITIGLRRRTTLGRLQSLQRSIELHGLIHPVLVRNGGELVAGHRRLEACRRLGWAAIPVRHVDQLTTEEFRAIELDENRERAALNDYDTSKARLAAIRQAEADLKAKRVSSHLGTKLSKRGRKGEGRPKKAGSVRDIGAETGISKTEQGRVERHVALAEAYPFMQRSGWLQYHVLEAGALLDALPERDRSAAAALLDQDAIPAKTAIAIMQNLSTLPRAERQEIFTLAHSEDEFDRRTALTRAAAVPPPVDPGLSKLGTAVQELRSAAKVCRTPEFKPKLDVLSGEAARLLTAFQEANDAARRTVSTPAPGAA